MCQTPDNPCLEPLLCNKYCNLAQQAEILLVYPSLEIKDEHSSLSWSHEIADEIKALSKITTPGIASGLLYYARNLISMLFLGWLGPRELAAGALSIGFANITGYSVLSGLSIGMEPICGQAYGAQNWNLVSQTLHRTILILLLTCIPISLLWLNVSHILLHLGQDPTITHLAKNYLLYALPDLIALSFINPLRIFLRTQNLNHVPAVCSTISTLLHIPLNYYFVIILGSGIKGVATAVAVTDFLLLFFVISYIYLSGVCEKTWTRMNLDCFKEWSSIFSLALPSCISVCLEWWWYEFMIILCGLLNNPEETVSAIGILMQMTALVYVFPSSLSYGVSTRVAQELGRGRPVKAKTVATIGTIWGVFMGIVAMAFNVYAMKWWGFDVY
ncbi:protein DETOXIFICATION 48-like [Dioscorea cayenensis subsp. rotundata]|uniref:Protein DETOXIFICATION 48-like n=1 Tax=Dioscorea cayennensis subsp. rotundata TaxID=55577 RepID=A0AB40B8B0_DIOCR|nr:protein DETOXIFICATION 48-like [Dioscorea cayenensis subsp. rotundata]